ncbi:MAG: DNA-directed RNA polymerase subunit alpha C-terminal domain-containing protein [Fusobacteriaceae bacterium]
MEKYNKDDLIQNLEISIRSKNALQLENINTIRELLDYNQQTLSNIQNLGKKSIDELLEIINSFKKKDSFFEIKDLFNKEQKKYFINKDQEKYIDFKIDELKLSVRCKNALKRKNINFLSEILLLNEIEIERIRNLGEKSKLEIIDFQKEVVLEKIDSSPDYSQEFINFIKKLEQEFDEVIIFSEHIIREIYSIFSHEKNQFNSKDNDLLKKILSIKNIRENLKNNMLQNIKLYEFGCSLDTIIANSILKFPELRDDLLIELLEERKIEIIEDDKYIIAKLSIKNLLKKYFDDKKINERDYSILCIRLEGKTLEELGDIFEVTRERVRQIEVKTLEKIKNNFVREDKYCYLYENYDISQEDFNIAFKKDKEAYNYLKIKFKSKGSISLDEALNDENISLKMKNNIEKATYKKYFVLNGERVLKNRASIIKYLCKTYSSNNDLEFEKLKKIYFLTIKKLNEENNLKFNFFDRSSENMLTSSNYILWKYGRKFRYYDINKNDYTDFLKQLNLNQYNNLEISTLKIFRLYPDLMYEYDIYDEYELHNLLKKICCPIEFSTVKFKKMPMLEFGNVDRDVQILDLLIKLSPIKNIEFAKQYEIEYGIKAQTLLGTDMKNYNNYSDNSIYNIEPTFLEDEEIEILKKYLSREFYTVKEFEEIFKSTFENKDLKYINGFNLKLLGYKLYSSYIISSEFESSREFFKTLFLKEEILDIENLNFAYKYIIAYAQELQKLRDDFELLEFSSKKYIKISKLEKFGVTKEYIEEFIKKVIEFIPDNTIFTYTHLKNLGFYHEFEDLGFEEYFYSSILSRKKESFSNLRKYGSILLKKGNYSISLLEIIEVLILSKENLSMDIYNLIEILENEYGLKINKSQILEQIRDSRIYYSPITEVIYGDYEIYYEEIGL